MLVQCSLQVLPIGQPVKLWAVCLSLQHLAERGARKEGEGNGNRGTTLPGAEPSEEKREADLAPFGTLGTLHPFLQRITFLLLHGTREWLACEWLVIIIIISSLQVLILFLSILLLAA